MKLRQANELRLLGLARWAKVLRGLENATPPRVERIASDKRGGEDRSETPQEAGSKIHVAASNMQELAAEISTCKKCALCSGRTNTVTGKGSTAKGGVMFIGEGPGEEEDLQGQPFVGRAGKILDEMLAALGLSGTERIYITNMVKCRPPGNRNPRKEEIASCMPYLDRQIDFLEPSLIVLLGNVAADALLKEESTLGSKRLKLHHYHGIPVLVQYHPAYLLRRPEEKRKAWRDLLLLQQHLGKTAQAKG